MRTYTIYLPPPTTKRGRETIVIPEGFNVWAALFSGLWAFLNGMWLLGIAIMLAVAAVVAGFHVAGVGEDAQTVVILAIAAVIGFSANDWYRAHLARKGWKQAAVIVAPDRDGALRRYLDLAALGRA